MRRFIGTFCVAAGICGIVLAGYAGTAHARPAPAVFRGEKIRYDIRKLGLKVGHAELLFRGSAHLNGRDAYLIIFRARALNFFDEEKIYVDQEHWRPIRVERYLNIWGKKERITEYYDQKKGKVRIVKKHGRRKTEQVLTVKTPVENIYGFIYRYRLHGRFAKHDTIVVNLPTTNVKMVVSGKDTIAAAGRKYKAYLIKSDPAKYRLWFGVTGDKIPLRIDGAVGIANTSMVMSGITQRHKKETDHGPQG